MSLSTQHIVRHLFRVESLEEVSRQQLEELVATYPSFGVGRYLLSRKLQAEAADNFVEETQKTNLYFTNPFWLQWLLQEARPANGRTKTEVVTERIVPAEEVFAPVVDPTEETLDTEVAPVEEPDEVGAPPAEVVEEVEEVPTASAADELLKSIAALRGERAEAQHKEGVSEEEAPSQAMSIAGLALGQLEEQEAPAVDDAADDAVDEDRHVPHTPVEDIHFVENNPATDKGRAGGEMEETGEDGTQVWETEQAPAGEVQLTATDETTAEEPQPIIAESIPEEVQPIVAEQAHVEEVPPVTETGQPAGEVFAPEAQDAGRAPVFEKPAEEVPVFEPFHTVDYFASQGIRLVLDEVPTDRLGQQMKSFTDWLKLMRRLPQKNREIIPDIAAEHAVQAIAAHSIERREIITETMAEVLAKQGMREKATEMYRKLSLLEPEKSAYFAEKIEKLKII